MARVTSVEVGLCRSDWADKSGHLWRGYSIVYYSGAHDGIEAVRFADVCVKAPGARRLTEKQARAAARRIADASRRSTR
jgi:hypothetical protein